VIESYHSHYLIVDITLRDTGFWLLKRQNIKNQCKQHKNANKRNNYLLFLERRIIKEIKKEELIIIIKIYAKWKQNTVHVIPRVISTTGVIPKSLSQTLNKLNLHPNT
jgi:hypothetical protein